VLKGKKKVTLPIGSYSVTAAPTSTASNIAGTAAKASFKIVASGK
jgi:hypothetical protein